MAEDRRRSQRNLPHPETSPWALQPSFYMYCWLVAQAVAALAARLEQALFALAAAVEAAVPSASWYLRALRCLQRTRPALFRSALGQVVLPGRA